MKKLVGLILAITMLLVAMLPFAALAEEPVTISFFDKNSGVREFNDPIAKELEGVVQQPLIFYSFSGDESSSVRSLTI